MTQERDLGRHSNLRKDPYEHIQPTNRPVGPAHRKPYYSAEEVHAATSQALYSGRRMGMTLFNHIWRVMWGRWKKAQPFKLKMMEVLYVALNERRPQWMSEIILNSWEANGPAPHFFDIESMSHHLSPTPDREMYIDVSYHLEGPLIVTGETCIYFDWPSKYRIPILIRATLQSLVARSRFRVSTDDGEQNWMQWLGKP